jgi:hypothetical protein
MMPDPPILIVFNTAQEDDEVAALAAAYTGRCEHILGATGAAANASSRKQQQQQFKNAAVSSEDSTLSLLITADSRYVA